MNIRDNFNTETVKEFLARGGKITVVNRGRSTHKSEPKEVKIDASVIPAVLTDLIPKEKNCGV